MPWVINFDRTSETPEFQMGWLREWSERIDDMKIRSDVAQAFKKGGGPIDASNLPKILELEGNISKLPSVFTSHNGIMVVAADIMATVTSLDPTDHQFFPLIVTDSQGTPDDRKWFGMIIYAEKKSIIREQSSVEPHFAYKDSWKVAFIEHHAENRRIALTRDALSGPNLWREKGYPYSMLMSDALKENFDAEGQQFFECWRADIETMPIQHRIAKQAG